MDKEQHLTFEHGITNVPSDTICSDNALEDCIGMTVDNGEHRVIQKPMEKITLPNGFTLLYVHDYSGVTRYIIQDSNEIEYSSDGGASWSTLAGSHGEASVESIGNTLIISDDNGLRYFLWDTKSEDPGYKVLGNAIPDISATFKLGTFRNDDIGYTNNYIWLAGMLDGLSLRQVSDVPYGAITMQRTIAGSKFANGKYEDAKAALIGLVSDRLNKVKEEKRFAFPFWARYAIRLYDGSYTKISNPFLLFPTVRHNWDIFTCDDDGIIKIMDVGDGAGGWAQTTYWPWHAKLFYQIDVNGIDLDDWSDIISGVDIFVSKEVKTFDMEGTWTIENCVRDETHDNPLFDGKHPTYDYCDPVYGEHFIGQFVETDRSTWNTRFKPAAYSDEEIIKKLVDSSTFYKIIEVNIEDIQTGSLIDATNKIDKNTLKNLETQVQLPIDDYYSRASLMAGIMKSYNSRLHIANIKRGFFGGFTNFSYTTYLSSQTSDTYHYYVDINTPSGLRRVHASASSIEFAHVWFYYPDPRAFKVTIIKGANTKLAELKLKQHPYLNGAYAFTQLPPFSGETMPSETITPPTTITDVEILDEHMFVSEANNPYVFNASGDITIQMGGITALAIQTMALGELEHGIHPLIVFSEKGISLLKLKDDGTYVRSDESSREVCNNPKSITETDGPVFFSSEKGLMVASGSSLGLNVTCASEQLSGKSETPFADFMKDAIIAYDYRDSLLWIFDGATHTGGVVGSQYCYIYNIKTGTFSRYDTGETGFVTNVVNGFPDFLLQKGNVVYSLLERPNINADTDDYAATIKTRPMKLENGLALKSIMHIRHIKDFSGSGTLTLTVYASDDLVTWRQLTSFRGKPWKYYKFQYEFAGLKATDRFAGTVLITQERRTNKLR